jgi:anti-sigma factor RsiW
MLHIPDDRLHAYLDQALDRLESADIESHLAECAACRAERDAIIMLRDRTTALLARAAARHAAGPPFGKIRALSDERRRVRQQRLQRTAWAASVVLALGTGWSASWYLHRSTAVPAGTQVVTVAPPPAAQPIVQPPLAQPPVPQLSRDVPAQPAVRAGAAAPEPADRSTEVALQPATHSPASAAKPAHERAPAAKHPPAKHADGELATVGRIPKDGQLENGGVWRTLSWDGAKEAAGDEPARIAGLPVMEVQVQGGNSRNRPTMVVAQQLSSGEVVRTIEGPAADVSALLGTRPGYVSGESAGPAVPAPGTTPGALGTAMALRRGDRMVAVAGKMSRDSLKAIMQRLNLMKK